MYAAIDTIYGKKESLELTINDGKTTRFMMMIPIYKEEMDLKLKSRVEGLIDKFSKYKVSDVIDINRVNACIHIVIKCYIKCLK